MGISASAWASYASAAAAGVGAAAAIRSQTVGSKKPGVPTPAGMPDPEAQAAARRRQAAELQTRTGRASTILTDDGHRLGG